MKSLSRQLKAWSREHEMLSAAAKEKCTLECQYHQGMSEMANSVLNTLPKHWTIYQLECVRIVDMDKQVDSLGLFFDIDEVKEVLTCYQKQRESQGFKVIHAADNGLFVDLHWENDQGHDQEVSLTILPLTVQ